MSADVIPLPLKEPQKQASLTPILSLTATAMNSVNAVILDRMQSEIPLIPALAGHLISGGGKRMRPMLTLAGAELVGYQGSRHHKLAAAVEFIHTATLLHDDVVDGSDLRRGKAARQHHLRQSRDRAGRRFPVQPRVRADGRGRQPQGAQDPLQRLGGDRRGRGRPAHRPAPDRDQRGALSRDHRLQDRGAVRRRQPDFGGGRRMRRGGGKGARRLRPQSRHRVPAGRRCARLRCRRLRRWARTAATISAKAR